MQRKLATFILVGASLVLASCGSQLSESPRNTLGTVELNIEVEAGLSAAASERPAPTFGAPELDADRPIIISRGGVIARVDASRIAGYRSDGFTLENDQLMTAFGETQGHLELLQADDLWRISEGEGMTVAVIDSGVDARHPALEGAVLSGYDFINDSVTVSDESGHGTAVAALIAGRGDVSGVAPKAKILPLRVLDKYDQGSSFNTIRAIRYAADLLDDMKNPHPADIINLSMGGYTYSPALHQAIKEVSAAGVVVIAAVGNNGADGVAYPAALPEVIGVGAGDVLYGEWTSAPFSNTGAGLDLLAPMSGLTRTNWGVYSESGVLSAEAGGQLTRVSGTSFAAPQVAGLAALIRSLGPDADRTVTLLKASASDVASEGWDALSGYGVVNPVASLRAATSVTPTDALMIQVLDAGSAQELSYRLGEAHTDLTLVPGDYVLNIWQDSNGDGLHQMEEPCYQSSALSLAAGEELEFNITLQ